ncbi:MAG: transposase [Clostridia bacterium]|nr:transposase [Clostridia bacterium]
MAYNLTRRVDLPPENSRIILPNGYVYYYTEMKYDPKTRKTKDNRKTVGKVCPDDSGKMYPNDHYYSLVLGVTAADNGNQRELTNDEYAESSYELPKPMAKHVNVGHYIGLYQAGKRIGCITALQKAFPKHWDKILAIAVYVIDTSCSTAQLFPYWGYQNYCGFDKPFSDSTISDLYSFIGKDDWAVDIFMQEFNRNYLQSVPSYKDRIIAFDSTNRNTTCTNNKYAQFGKPKIKKDGVPQVNTALMVDETTGIPMYYENYYGSLLDKTETPVTMERIQELGFQHLMFVMDCGYASKDVIDSIKDHLEFSVMTPESYDVVKYMMDKYAVRIRDNTKYYLWEENAYGVYEEDVPAFGNKYIAYLYYDAERGKQEIDSIHDKANALLRVACKRKRYSDKFQKQYAPYILIQKTAYNPVTKTNYAATINVDAIDKEVQKAGFFVVVSNVLNTPQSILRITRERDKGEKAFERFKSSLDMAASGTQSTLTFEGKTFLAFIALILTEAFRWYEKPIISAKTSTTFETCLAELRNFQVQKKNIGGYMPLTALTNKQKELFENLGLRWDSVMSIIRTMKAITV